MTKSPIITEVGAPEEWLYNPTAGDMLRTEFLEPLELTASDLAPLLGVEAQRLTDVINGRRKMDADLDLRLGRYFGISEGFFIRLQNAHELLEAKRAHAAEIDRIERRAA